MTLAGEKSLQQKNPFVRLRRDYWLADFLCPTVSFTWFLPLKLNNSKIILQLRSRKLIHAETHFLSHFEKKKKIKNLKAGPGFEPTKGRLEAHCTNHYTTHS